MTALTAQEERWISRVAVYLGVPRPDVISRDNIPDIASSIPGVGSGKVLTILLGRKFLKDRPNSLRRLKKLAHESLHYIYPHDQYMRDHGYYSSPRKDRLSERIRDDILSGGRAFEPARWGLMRVARHNPYRIQWVDDAMTANPYRVLADQPEPNEDGEYVFIDRDTLDHMQGESDSGTLEFDTPELNPAGVWGVIGIAVAALVALKVVSRA